MGLPIGKWLRKAFGFLVPIIVEEVRKEIQQRTDEPPPVRSFRSSSRPPTKPAA